MAKKHTITKLDRIEFEDMNEALKSMKQEKENQNPKKKKRKQEKEEVFLFEKEKLQKPKKQKEKPKEVKKKKQKQKKKKIIVKKIQVEEEQKREKKKKRVYKIIKYSILVILILVAIIAALYSPLFNVQKIEVKGNQKITTEEITTLSGIKLEESTFKMNTSKVRQNIKQNAYIDSVEIKRKLPEEIEIVVVERTATFMIEYGGGYVYLNNQGYMLEISTQKLDIPILQGGETLEGEIKVGNRICKEDLQKLSRVLKIMESASNIGIESLISRIDIANNGNYKLIFDSELKTAYMGDESNLSTKMLYIKALLEDNKTIAGEIFVNMDLNTNNPFFRKQV